MSEQSQNPTADAPANGSASADALFETIRQHDADTERILAERRAAHDRLAAQWVEALQREHETPADGSANNGDSDDA